MDLKRVLGFVGQTEADAWIVVAGSREILSWFADQPCPSIALFGRFTGVKIASASPRAALANVQAVRRLVALGHRRIVMLVRWAKNTAAGKTDTRQTLIPGELIEGGTIGPAPG